MASHRKPWLLSGKESASLGSMHDTGCLGLVHWDDPEDGMGREEGGGFRMGAHVYLWRIHFDIWQNQYNIVKFKKKKKKKKPPAMEETWVR